MSISSDLESLSPHLKYAITKNAILWKGEHQQKLKAINQDYRIKADEIWHNRTQAARDYVMDVINSSNQNSSTLKSSARICASRDREAMQRIQELSEIYLSQAMMQRVDTKRLRESLAETSKKPAQSFFLTQQTSEHSSPTLPQILESRVKRESWSERRESMRYSGNRDSFGPESRRDVQTQQCSRVRSRSVCEESTQSADISRPSTTNATLPIRRTSCRLSNNAKSLRELQRMQQRQRLLAPTRKTSYYSPIGGFSNTPKATEYQVGSQAVPGTMKDQLTHDQGVDSRIRGFCDRIALSSESQQWKKYNSKWSVLRDYVRSSNSRASSRSSPRKTDDVRNLCDLDLPERDSRKLSVHWSDPVVPGPEIPSKEANPI